MAGCAHASSQTIPARIRWAVDIMDVQPADQVLEIGCGPGYAAELICERLEKGKLLAIDRSESGVDRTKRRAPQFIEAGRLTVRQIDLATLRVPVKRLDKVFAFNVNLFWVRDCDDEVALLHERVSPGGGIYLFFEVTGPERAADRGEGVGRPGQGGLPGRRGREQEARGDRPDRPALTGSRLIITLALGKFLI